MDQFTINQQKFWQNDEINPHTNKRLIKGKGPYLKLLEKYVLPIKIVIPKNESDIDFYSNLPSDLILLLNSYLDYKSIRKLVYYQ